MTPHIQPVDKGVVICRVETSEITVRETITESNILCVNGAGNGSGTHEETTHDAQPADVRPKCGGCGAPQRAVQRWGCACPNVQTHRKTKSYGGDAQG